MAYPSDLPTVTVRTRIVGTDGDPAAARGGKHATAVLTGRLMTGQGSIVPTQYTTPVDPDGWYEFKFVPVDHPAIVAGKGEAYRIAEPSATIDVRRPGRVTTQQFHVYPLMEHVDREWVDVSEIIGDPPSNRDVIIQAGTVTDEAAASLLAIEGGKFKASLSDTIATEADAPARAAAVDELSRVPEVADAAATRAVTVAADPAIAGALADPDSAASEVVARTVKTMTNALQFGLIGDNATDNATAFEAACASGEQHLYLPAGDYRHSRSFKPAPGQSWTLDANARLIPTTDIDVLVMTPGARVHGGRIDIESSPLATFTKAAILFSGKFNVGTNHVVSGMTVRGKGNTSGTALKLTCPTAGDFINWVLADGLYLSGFERLIWLDGTTPGTWINANTFQGIVLGVHKHAIYVDRDGATGADGNVFRVTGQASAGGQRVIYCSGKHNVFDVMVFDVGNGGLTPVYAEFTPGSTYNTLAVPANPELIIDNGTNNRVQGRGTENLDYMAFEPVAPFSYAPEGSPAIAGAKLVGNQDDWLAGSHARHPIAQTVGPAHTSGNLTNITRLNPAMQCSWVLDAAGEVTFEIDLAADKMLNPRLMGLVFEYAYRPTKILVQLVDDTQGARTVLSTTTNTKDIVTFRTYGFGASIINRIRVTLGVPQNANRTIRLVRLWAVAGSGHGRAWLPTAGGQVHGDIEFLAGTPVLRSPNGTRYRLTVGNDGTLATAPV